MNQPENTGKIVCRFCGKAHTWTYTGSCENWYPQSKKLEKQGWRMRLKADQDGSVLVCPDCAIKIPA